MNKNKKTTKKQDNHNKPKLLNEDALDEIELENSTSNTNYINNTHTNNINNSEDMLKQLQNLMNFDGSNLVLGDNNLNPDGKNITMGDILSKLENIIKTEIPKEQLDKELELLNNPPQELKKDTDEEKENPKAISIKELMEKIDKDIENEPNEVKHYYAKGELMKFLLKGDIAKKCYEKCIELDPNNPEYYFSEGELYELMNQDKEALATYKIALNLTPDDSKLILKVASVLNKLEKYEEALDLLDKFIEKNPNNSVGWELKGITLKKINKFEDAINAYNKSIEIQKNNFNCFYNKGILHQNLNQLEEAKECYKNANKCKTINNNFAWVNLASIYKNEGNMVETANCFKEALTIDELDFEIYLPYAYSLESLNKNEEAISILKNFEKKQKKISSKEITDLNFYKLMGDLHKKINLLDEAKKYYSHILDENSLHKETILAKTNNLNTLKKYEEAIKLLNEELEKNPNDLEYLINKALSLQGMEKFEDSNLLLDKVIKIDQNIPDVYSIKGFNLMKLNLLNDSIFYYNKSMEMNPKNDIAIWNLGICYVENKQLEKAFDTFEKYNNLIDNNFSSYNAIGSILINLGRFKESISYLDKSIKLNDKFAMTFFYKGVSLQNLNEYEDAIDSYDNALNIDPKMELAKNNKKAIWAELRKLTKLKKED
jgi:tetratricopeptide (TPR) repeat protein